MSYPKELNYGHQKPNAVPAKPEIIRYRSQNGEYRNNDVIRIEINTGKAGMHLFPHSTFLEGKVRVNMTAAGDAAGATSRNGCRIDQSAYSLFKRYRLLHGNETQEDLLHPNRLWNSIYDVQKNDHERNGDSISLLTDSFKSGLGRPFVRYSTTAGGSPPGLTGDSLPLDFAFCLPSGLIGTLAQMSVPLSVMGASNLFLELELEDVLKVFTTIPAAVAAADGLPIIDETASINSYTVSDLYMNCKVCMLPSDIELALFQSIGPNITIHSVGYKGELKTISQNSTTFNDKIAFSFNSIKSFMFFNANQSVANGVLTQHAITTRPFINLLRYHLTMNGVQYPSQSIENPSVMYQNLLRCFDANSDTNFGGIIDNTNYTSGTGADAANSIGRFLGGIDLDRFNNNGISEVMITGTNTVGQSINLVQFFSQPTPQPINVYCFCMYDCIFELSGGLLKCIV